MENDLIKILNKFRKIEPDADYAKKSKMLILSSRKKEANFKFSFNMRNVFEMLRFSAIFIVVFFLIASVIGGVSYINKEFSPLNLEGLNQKSLTTEAKSINNSIQGTLEEIKYLDQANKKAIHTITEVSKNNPVYSNIISTSSSSTASSSTSTEDIQNFLITSPTSTDGSNQDINNLLDKASQ